ncbi:MAG: type II toxin-antitoxin system RelE/ParE family toxin [Flavobacteriales bacterium]|nr:type II toxin-antitoxin system RelE/ParE family toxin [Flavobacteriales bacterium]MBK6753128.1 type II toxin-antitoxin system RelE/ParE family toxin [Flavobacteriales bacterium]MBK7269831.1 type II toxin-antitoxin system RelE/ParE family toxin [Flavobacteriales bacterium]MBK7556063.1 type II toxin-antitoxin system RelE/ParE family toxin [Flavobacteriales bacterium]MBK9076654.1 type II toxin-antitoxin system RelE/ParE family toxin [Flavobacteriales bacterium]
MSSSPIFRARAREDMAAAYRWYEDRRTGLGELLLLEVHRCIGYILKTPGGFQRIHGPFRQAPVEHFPFVVIYRSSGS